MRTVLDRNGLRVVLTSSLRSRPAWPPAGTPSPAGPADKPQVTAFGEHELNRSTEERKRTYRIYLVIYLTIELVDCFILYCEDPR